MVPSLRRFGAAIPRVPAIVVAVFACAMASFWWTVVRMPGASFSGSVSGFSAEERALSATLERDVTHLALDIGERNLRRPEALQSAVQWLESELQTAGLAPKRQTYPVEGFAVHNLEVVLPGRRGTGSEVVVVGAHYDSAIGTPGANDNASGVAALLAIARNASRWRPETELRLAWFTNEEQPHFQTSNMGSLRYAQRLAREDRKVLAMLSLETIGYYSEQSGSQRYPDAVTGFFPSTGNFLAFVGDSDSKNLVRAAIGCFRRSTPFPSEGLGLSDNVLGVGWSDHWSFWQIHAPAIMITDTALFRYEHYHRPTDTPDRIDYRRLARVTLGLGRVVRALIEGADGTERHCK